MSLWDDIYDAFIYNDRWKYVLSGLENTIILTVMALILGMILGVMIACVRTIHDKNGKLPILNIICRAYVTVIRGTPVMVQLLIIYLVVLTPNVIGFRINPLITGSLAFGLNSAAYVAEIVRSGINAVPAGQFEAARSLGLSFGAMMTTVILPQAVKNILPALCNEGISLLKETSICGVIGVVELTKSYEIIMSFTYQAMVPLIGIALIYLTMVMILTALVHKLERRLNANAI